MGFAIMNMVKCFQETGNLSRMKNRTRRTHARTTELIEQVRKMVLEEVQISINGLFAQMRHYFF